MLFRVRGNGNCIKRNLSFIFFFNNVVFLSCSCALLLLVLFCFILLVAFLMLYFLLFARW
jgi:hypothetical protein